MSGKPSLKLVAINDVIVPKKERISIRNLVRTASFYNAIRIVLGLAILSTTGIGFFPEAFGLINSTATIWATAFIFTIILWLLEILVRKIFYLQVARIY